MTLTLAVQFNDNKTEITFDGISMGDLTEGSIVTFVNAMRAQNKAHQQIIPNRASSKQHRWNMIPNIVLLLWTWCLSCLGLESGRPLKNDTQKSSVSAPLPSPKASVTAPGQPSQRTMIPSPPPPPPAVPTPTVRPAPRKDSRQSPLKDANIFGGGDFVAELKAFQLKKTNKILD